VFPDLLSPGMLHRQKHTLTAPESDLTPFPARESSGVPGVRATISPSPNCGAKGPKVWILQRTRIIFRVILRSSVVRLQK